MADAKARLRLGKNSLGREFTDAEVRGLRGDFQNWKVGDVQWKVNYIARAGRVLNFTPRRVQERLEGFLRRQKEAENAMTGS